MSFTVLINKCSCLPIQPAGPTPPSMPSMPSMPFAMVPVWCWPGLSSLLTLTITSGRVFDISSSVCHPKSSPALLLVSLSTISIRKPSQALKFSNWFPQAIQGKNKTCKIPTLCICVQSLEDSLSLPS